MFNWRARILQKRVASKDIANYITLFLPEAYNFMTFRLMTPQLEPCTAYVNILKKRARIITFTPAAHMEVKSNAIRCFRHFIQDTYGDLVKHLPETFVGIYCGAHALRFERGTSPERIDDFMKLLGESLTVSDLVGLPSVAGGAWFVIRALLTLPPQELKVEFDPTGSMPRCRARLPGPKMDGCMARDNIFIEFFASAKYINPSFPREERDLFDLYTEEQLGWKLEELH